MHESHTTWSPDGAMCQPAECASSRRRLVTAAIADDAEHPQARARLGVVGVRGGVIVGLTHTPKGRDGSGASGLGAYSRWPAIGGGGLCSICSSTSAFTVATPSL